MGCRSSMNVGISFFVLRLFDCSVVSDFSDLLDFLEVLDWMDWVDGW